MVKERGRYTKRNAWDEAYDLKVYRGGEKLDPGVKFFVLMLDQLGLPTYFSCEGHPSGFYVTFRAPYEIALEIQRTGYFSVEIEGEDYWSIRQHYRGENKTDGLRWAADAWEKKFGRLDFDKVLLIA